VFIASYLPNIRLKLETLPVPFTLSIGASSLIVMMITKYFIEFDNQVDLVRLINGPIAFLVMYIILNLGRIILLPKTVNQLIRSFATQVIYLGKVSMVIYLFHGYFTRSTIIFLLKFLGRPEPILYFILASSMGVLGSVIFYNILIKKSNFLMYSIGSSK
jgi:hypothetical protein